MIELPFFNGLPVAVLGLGKSGLSAARALSESGAEVWAWDDSEERRAAAEAEGVPLVELTGCDWRELTSLVISPGIPHSHPAPHAVATLARQHGCEIIGDIELLGRAQRNATYLGVSGTNGKTPQAKVTFLYQQDAPSCHDCGAIMVRNGSCYKCLECGSTSGCS